MQKNNYPYLAMSLLKKSLIHHKKKPGDLIDNLLGEVASLENEVLFQTLSFGHLKFSTANIIKYLRGIHYFRIGKYKKALFEFRQIPEDSTFYSKSLFVIGMMFNYNERYESAQRSFQLCLKRLSPTDETEIRLSDKEATLRDMCEIAIPRVQYKLNTPDETYKLYEAIKIDSSRWPNALLEQSWLSYQNSNYSKSIAKALLLQKSEFNHLNLIESQILVVLNFYKNCYFDSLLSFSDHSIKLLNEQKEKFSNLKKAVWNLEDPYVKKRIAAMEGIQKEADRLKKVKETWVREAYLDMLESEYNLLREQATIFGKKKLENMVKSIENTKKDILAIKLKAVNKMKGYKQSPVAPQTKEKQQKNIVKWSFGKEFWPDEIKNIKTEFPNRCELIGEV
ncbi:MAG: hypothetical protein ACPGJV_01095 [Bacteriovoracaceae bacterium]